MLNREKNSNVREHIPLVLFVVRYLDSWCLGMQFCGFKRIEGVCEELGKEEKGKAEYTNTYLILTVLCV